MTAKRGKGKKAAKSATVRSLHARADMKNEQIFFLGGRVRLFSSSLEGPKRKEEGVGMQNPISRTLASHPFSWRLVLAAAQSGPMSEGEERREARAKKASP